MSEERKESLFWWNSPTVGDHFPRCVLQFEGSVYWPRQEHQEQHAGVAGTRHQHERSVNRAHHNRHNSHHSAKNYVGQSLTIPNAPLIVYMAQVGSPEREAQPPVSQGASGGSCSTGMLANRPFLCVRVYSCASSSLLLSSVLSPDLPFCFGLLCSVLLCPALICSVVLCFAMLSCHVLADPDDIVGLPESHIITSVRKALLGLSIVSVARNVPWDVVCFGGNKFLGAGFQVAVCMKFERDEVRIRAHVSSSWNQQKVSTCYVFGVHVPIV